MTLKESFKKFMKPRRADAIDFVRDPEHDWTRLLIGFVVGVAVIVAIDGYIFYGIDQGSLFQTPEPAPTVDVVNRTTLGRIAAFYIAKQNTLNSIPTSPVPADPSR